MVVDQRGHVVGEAHGSILAARSNAFRMESAAYPDSHGPRRWAEPSAMTQTLASIGVVLFFILVAAVFVAAEIALVSLRDSQAAQLANRGRRGRIVAEL